MVDLHLSLEPWPNGRDLRSIFSLVRVCSRGVAGLLEQLSIPCLIHVLDVVSAALQLLNRAVAT